MEPVRVSSIPEKAELARTGDIVACNSKGTDLGFVMSAIMNRLMPALRDKRLVGRS